MYVHIQHSINHQVCTETFEEQPDQVNISSIP